ncbi:twin-arginine translocase TatA/TatE family subunit [Kocuria carniphila]|uniref:twin-arginine translocase TatA/TatE family subunit n=1 Tax=Kocuria carniphila TaxID=262208 RepID=UPI00101CD53D|nr:twin-arginine translocase TatA/TatE family subunit [Kocuria carniphila]
MFGISGGEAILILVVALVVIGPERLPEYAEKLKDLIKSLKRYATGAKDDLRETLGPEFSDVDWRKLDPRQYDPRVIVREALMEDDEPQIPGYQAASVAAPTVRRLEPGERAPFDTEAT